MKHLVIWGRGHAAWLGWMLCCTAAAEPPQPPEAPASTARALVLHPFDFHGYPGTPERASSGASSPRALALPVSVVELPLDGPPGLAGQRRHHALSIRSEAPERMLRSLGIEASECAMRLRAPSKLKQDPGGNATLNIQAQVGLACRF